MFYIVIFRSSPPLQAIRNNEYLILTCIGKWDGEPKYGPLGMGPRYWIGKRWPKLTGSAAPKISSQKYCAKNKIWGQSLDCYFRQVFLGCAYLVEKILADEANPNPRTSVGGSMLKQLMSQLLSLYRFFSEVLKLINLWRKPKSIWLHVQLRLTLAFVIEYWFACLLVIAVLFFHLKNSSPVSGIIPPGAKTLVLL